MMLAGLLLAATGPLSATAAACASYDTVQVRPHAHDEQAERGEGGCRERGVSGMTAVRLAPCLTSPLCDGAGRRRCAALAHLTPLHPDPCSALSDVAPALQIQLKWLQQAQFAGYMVAAELGFYREQCLEVSSHSDHSRAESRMHLSGAAHPPPTGTCGCERRLPLDRGKVEGRIGGAEWHCRMPPELIQSSCVIH